MLNQSQSLNQLNRNHSIVWGLIDAIFPPFCCNCGVLGFELCPDCGKQIQVLDQEKVCPICGDISNDGKICSECEERKPYFDQLRSWGVYSGVLREVIQKVKFNHGLGLIDYFIKPSVALIRSWSIDIDHIVPVPLSRSRHHTRGYNQVELIARPISKGLEVPFLPQSICRVKETLSQVGLNALEREENVLNAFKADLEETRDKTILVIDDISTTGATLNECAKALKNAGAKKVYCYTLARTLNTKIQ